MISPDRFVTVDIPAFTIDLPAIHMNYPIYFAAVMFVSILGIFLIRLGRALSRGDDVVGELLS